MTAPMPQTKSVFPELDSVIADSELLDAPRAFLLLRVCQFAQLFRPDLLRHYWDQLLKLNKHLPAEHREAYEGLRAVIDPAAASGEDKSGSLGKFAQEIVDRVNEAVQKAQSDRDAAMEILRGCEKQLDGRWWPFGKRDAWVALVVAWADIDRKESLRLLDKLRRGAQHNLVNRLNEHSLFSQEEWDLAHKKAKGGIIPVIVEILDKEKPELHVSPELAAGVASNLLSDIHATSWNPEDSRKISAQRTKGLIRYLALVDCRGEDPSQVEALMERLFSATADTSCYGDVWLDRFSVMRQIIIAWAAHIEVRGKAESFFSSLSNRHIRDFAIAQWHAMVAAGGQEAEAGFKTVGDKCSDKLSSEAWFLATLVRRGFSEAALRLAQSSPRSGNLLPIVRRAWLCEHPETTASTITAEEMKDDLIGQFLLAGSTEKRVEFLREKTRNGAGSLPKELWSKPGFEMATIIDGTLTSDLARKACPRWFSKKQSPENQFRDFVRLHGYGQYSYEDVDPLLLATLVAWSEQHPEEVESLMSKIWNEMKPDDWELMTDLIRDAIFERCQGVLCARPKSFNEMFVKWIKSRLVDSHVERNDGQTIYRFSLKDIVPFLYCVLSAQKVGRFSPKRCDELLEIALNQYPASEELMTAAAEIYASDKGLKALKWRVPDRNRSRFLKNWQMGIIQTSAREVMAMMIASAVDTAEKQATN